MTEQHGGAISAGRSGLRIAVAIVMSILVFALFAVMCSLGRRSEATYLKLMTGVIGLLFSVTLYVACCYRNRENTQQGKTLVMASVLLFFNLLLSTAFDTIDGMPELGGVGFALQTATSMISTLIQFIFWSYQCASMPEDRAQRGCTHAVYFFGSCYLVMLTVNSSTRFMFAVNASGWLIYTPVGVMIEIVNILTFYLIFLFYILPQHCPAGKKLSLASFAIFPFIGLALATVWAMFGIKPFVLSTTYIFQLLAAYVVFFGDFEASQELLLTQKAELAEQKRTQTELQTALMLSQMQPHFLYNALTAIRNLCKYDPEEAYTVLGQFADYLRGNMEVLGSGRIISFEKELEHIKTYLMLQQMRFTDELRVEYDIQYQDFSLPALTVQPIVENAVRYGALMNENGGVVTIRTERTESGAIITVTDNGPGFDQTAPLPDDRSHVGLSGVRACLEATDRGEVYIESAAGVGTSVTITIWEGKA